MLALDIKQQSSDTVSSLKLSKKEKKPLLSFASLLNTVKVKDEPLKSSNKSDFLSLLGKKQDDALNPQLTASMSSIEIKQLMHQAKKYIKSQIYSSDAFKKHEIASLPKSLKGLIQVAKKIGIDISKITLEKVQEYSPESRTQSKLKPLRRLSAFNIVQDEKKIVKPKPSELSTAIALKQEIPEDKQKSVKSSTAFNIVQDEKKIVKPKPSELSTAIALKQEIPKAKQKSVKSSTAFNIVQDDKTVIKPKLSKTSAAFSDMKEFPKEQKITASKNRVQRQESKETPLFKVEQKTEISTQELVKVKTLKQEPVHKKEKVQNSLESLLRADKALQNTNIATPLTTAKVIVSSVKTVSPKNLEALLKTPKSKSKNEVIDTKPEVMYAPKAESFEVKIHEAKQMVKYLSHDVKNAIEDYKSPFSRIKVQLNPQKLGEVDLTIVQRGKNLHINLSSNNTAINTLAMNANDLKMQLNNSGINNASLNFSNNSQGEAFANSGQQQQQQRQNAQNEYNYIEHEEKNEEILNSLEIVVPNYA